MLQLRADPEGKSPGTVEGVVIDYSDISPSHGERIAPQAFQWGNSMRLALQHERAADLGPLALRDSDTLLIASARLDDTPLGRVAADLVERGTLRGFSAAFQPLRHSPQADGTILVQRADLVYVGLVDRPSYPMSQISMRAETDKEALFSSRIVGIRNEAQIALPTAINANLSDVLGSVTLDELSTLDANRLRVIASEFEGAAAARLAPPLQTAASGVARATAQLTGRVPTQLTGLMRDYALQLDRFSTEELGRKLVDLAGDKNDLAVLSEQVAKLRSGLAEKLGGRGAAEGVGRAQMYALRDSGIEYAIWRTTGRENCPFCNKLNGRRWRIGQQVVARDEDISVDGRRFTPSQARLHPPLHGGCDCYIVPELQIRKRRRVFM